MSESFIKFLDRYGAEREPSLQYDAHSDIDSWREDFFEAVKSLRGPVPQRVEPSLKVVESWEEEDHIRQLVRVPVSELTTLVAYLLLPKKMDGSEKRPGLIAAHGHTTHGIDTTSGVMGMDDEENAQRAYGLEAVRSGYVVIAPSWWGWHGRDGHLDRVGNRDKCNVIQHAASMYGMNLTDLHIQDGQAAIDVLASHPNVNSDRIGCIGNSYGGRSTMWLTIFDDRIKACVPAGCMNTFRERALKLGSCGIQYLPGILRYGDVPDLFCLIAPRAIQLQAGAKDDLITPSDRDMIDRRVRSAYEQTGAGDRYEFVLHPDGHFLKWELAEPFLQSHL